MFKNIWYRFRRHPVSIIAIVVIAAISIGAGIAFLSPYDPYHSNIQEKLQPPSLAHPMGTDVLGRDVLTRVLYGGRRSLLIGLGVALISLVIGVPIGMAAGYYGGLIDSILMRITDMFLSFPSIFVLILFSAILRETDVQLSDESETITVIFAIGVLSWMTIARLVRASFLYLKETEFIIAAHALGASNFRIITRHILPNTVGPIIVAATLGVAHAILTESGLSFIGFGIHPRTPTWGNMLSTAQSHIIKHPWTAIFPGLMIFITILAINYIGDGLRDSLDPHKVMKYSSKKYLIRS